MSQYVCACLGFFAMKNLALSEDFYVLQTSPCTKERRLAHLIFCVSKVEKRVRYFARQQDQLEQGYHKPEEPQTFNPGTPDPSLSSILAPAANQK